MANFKQDLLLFGAQRPSNVQPLGIMGDLGNLCTGSAARDAASFFQG